MVKHTGKGGGSAKLRLIVLEAEVPEGDVSQLAQALQNALRPAQGLQQRVISSVPQIANAPEAQESATEGEAPGLEVPRTLPTSRPRQNKQRSYRTPDLVDLDAKQVASWKAFAGAKAPKSDLDKYVLAVAQDNAAEDGVTTDHVFTCFRQMKWNVAIEDFGGPLRSLKAAKHVKILSKGRYVVTQLGIQRVDEMDSAAP